ncbi:hypothetical protein [Litorivita sp. NS0012-18]|uniref:hypothetical protein n=1 Tax=Litorivita sp. NS0012-18 TaxID=3127655 RepID=UPI00333F962E
MAQAKPTAKSAAPKAQAAQSQPAKAAAPAARKSTSGSAKSQPTFTDFASI